MTDTNCYPTFPKIPRLHKDVVITEKVDGTNGLIQVEELPERPSFLHYGQTYAEVGGKHYAVRAGSRNRWLTIAEDNAGFAAFVNANAQELALLGPGNHYGEWYGNGIQRGYGLPGKEFALFNVARWYDPTRDHMPSVARDYPKAVACPRVCTVVPTLWTGPADTLNRAVQSATKVMGEIGSVIAPGFDRPEGLIVYHVAAGQYFKVLFEGDNTPKSRQKASA